MIIVINPRRACAARVTVVVPYVCVCLCLCVVFCHHAHLDPEIMVRTCSPRHGKTFMFVIFARNDSFRSYDIICLPRMPPTTPTYAPKYGYQRNPRNVGMTLLFAILTINASFRSYESFAYLLSQSSNFYRHISSI